MPTIRNGILLPYNGCTPSEKRSSTAAQSILDNSMFYKPEDSLEVRSLKIAQALTIGVRDANPKALAKFVLQGLLGEDA